MNTENIKTAIMKAAFSDPKSLWKALNLVLNRIEVSFRFESTVGWLFNNLRVFGYIFEQEADPFRGNAIKKEDIDFIADIIAENADELAVSMPQHLAEVIGLESAIDETEEGVYSLKIKKAGETVFEGSKMQTSEVYAQLDDRIAKGFDCELREDGRLMSAIWFYLHYEEVKERASRAHKVSV